MLRLTTNVPRKAVWIGLVVSFQAARLSTEPWRQSSCLGTLGGHETENKVNGRLGTDRICGSQRKGMRRDVLQIGIHGGAHHWWDESQ